jgi:tetratricopeptide (TPR) repeat protein
MSNDLGCDSSVIGSTGSKWMTGSRNIRHTIFSEAVLEAFQAELKGDKLTKLGMDDKAAREYDRTIAIEEEFFGDEHPVVLAFHEKLEREEGWEKTAIRDATNNLVKAIRYEQAGNKLRKLGQNEKAVREFEKALKIESAILG